MHPSRENSKVAISTTGLHVRRHIGKNRSTQIISPWEPRVRTKTLVNQTKMAWKGDPSLSEKHKNPTVLSDKTGGSGRETITPHTE